MFLVSSLVFSPSTKQRKTGTSPQTPQAPVMSLTLGKLLSLPGTFFSIWKMGWSLCGDSFFQLLTFRNLNRMRENLNLWEKAGSATV